MAICVGSRPGGRVGRELRASPPNVKTRGVGSGRIFLGGEGCLYERRSFSSTGGSVSILERSLFLVVGVWLGVRNWL